MIKQSMVPKIWLEVAVQKVEELRKDVEKGDLSELSPKIRADIMYLIGYISSLKVLIK